MELFKKGFSIEEVGYMINSNWSEVFNAIEFINTNYGIDIVSEPQKIKSLLLDLAPNSKQESKIFTYVLLEQELIKRALNSVDVNVSFVAQQIENRVGMSKEHALNAAKALIILLRKDKFICCDESVGFDAETSCKNTQVTFNAEADDSNSYNKIFVKNDLILVFGELFYGLNNCDCSFSNWTDIVAISSGLHHAIGLKEDGTVVAVGENKSGECDVNSWVDIVAIATGPNVTVGLKKNGTVVATGSNQYDECQVGTWSNVVAISCIRGHTIGLKSDGTILKTGISQTYGDLDSWNNIIDIAAGGSWAENRFFAGIRADGKVVVTGEAVSLKKNIDVQGWNNIISIDAGSGILAGLQYDGTVKLTGKFPKIYSWLEIENDIKSISVCREDGIGILLKKDGKVVAVQHDKIDGFVCENWENIAAVSTGGSYVIGLKNSNPSLKISTAAHKHRFYDFKKMKNRLEGKISEEYKQKNLCQHCGGSFAGVFKKRCCDCGKEKDY